MMTRAVKGSKSRSHEASLRPELGRRATSVPLCCTGHRSPGAVPESHSGWEERDTYCVEWEARCSPRGKHSATEGVLLGCCQGLSESIGCKRKGRKKWSSSSLAFAGVWPGWNFLPTVGPSNKGQLGVCPEAHRGRLYFHRRLGKALSCCPSNLPSLASRGKCLPAPGLLSKKV